MHPGSLIEQIFKGQYHPNSTFMEMGIEGETKLYMEGYLEIKVGSSERIEVESGRWGKDSCMEGCLDFEHTN